MSEWREYKLGEITNLVNRGVSPSYVENSGDVILNQKCIRNGRIDFSFSRLTSIFKKYTEEKVLISGDILINSTGVGTAGRVGLFNYEQRCFVDTHVSIVRVRKELADPLFVFYNLFRREDEIEGYAEGSTGQIELGREKIKEIDIFLPPTYEQTAIASILSSLDDKIDLLHRQNQTLEKMAETLFRQWFVDEEKEDATALLGDYAKNIRTNARTEDLNKFDHYIGLEHIPRKKIVINEWGTTDSLGSNKSVFKKNDILFGKLRSYFHKLVFAPFGGVCSTDILVIRPIREEWFTFCLFWFSNSELVEFSDLGSGGTRMPRTNWEIISNYVIPKPDEERILEFDRIVRPMINKLEQSIKEIRTLTSMRDNLLPKLMSGAVRVEM